MPQGSTCYHAGTLRSEASKHFTRKEKENVKDFQPKDAATALRLALRYERAKQILAEGYTFPRDEELQTIFVCKPGRLFAHYWITDGKCDCPDFLKHADFCKHTLAVYLQDEEDRQADEQAAEYARGNEDCEVLSSGCDPHSRF